MKFGISSVNENCTFKFYEKRVLKTHMVYYLV